MPQSPDFNQFAKLMMDEFKDPSFSELNLKCDYSIFSLSTNYRSCKFSKPCEQVVRIKSQNSPNLTMTFVDTKNSRFDFSIGFNDLLVPGDEIPNSSGSSFTDQVCFFKVLPIDKF